MSDYTCKITQSNGCFEWKDYTVDFEAEATYIHEDMVMYYKDGSGYPGYDGIDDVNWTINSVTDEDGNELCLGQDNYPVSFTEDQKKELEKAINEYLDTHDWDYPESDEPDEPDWEPEFEED